MALDPLPDELKYLKKKTCLNFQENFAEENSNTPWKEVIF